MRCFNFNKFEEDLQEESYIKNYDGVFPDVLLIFTSVSKTFPF